MLTGPFEMGKIKLILKKRKKKLLGTLLFPLRVHFLYPSASSLSSSLSMKGTRGWGLRVDRLQLVSLSLGGIRVEMVSSDWLGSSVSALEVRVLVHLGGAQRVSSVDSGGRRSTDVGLVCELGLVLAVVQVG